MLRLNRQRNPARQLCGLALAVVALVIGIALPLASTTVGASVKQSSSGSISSAHAQQNPLSLNSWSSNGPEGADILALAIDPSNPATIYAGTQGREIFKSTDSGGSWAKCNLTAADVFSLAIDPKTPTTLYAGGYGAFKSTDGCTSWNAINNGLSNVNSVPVTTLGIDPTNPNIIYAVGGGTGGGIFKTTDGGASWRGVYNGIFYFLALAIDPGPIGRGST